MNPLSDPEVLRKLFVRRTHHLPLLVAEKDQRSGSRLGGHAPACLAEASHRCPESGDILRYQLTLAEDLIGPLLGPGRALSALFCPDLNCRMRSWEPIARPSLVVLAHEDCPRGRSRSPVDSGLPGRALAFGALAPDLDTSLPRHRPHPRSKLGGKPHYIQEEPYKERMLREQGLRYLFQFEEAYPRPFFERELPFMGGAMWAFARLDARARSISDQGLQAFWECT